LQPGAARNTKLTDPRKERFDKYPNLHARQVRPDAAMHACTERQVAVLTAIDDDFVGTGKHSGITVGRAKKQTHLVPGLYALAGHLDIAGRSPKQQHRRSLKTKALFHKGRDKRKIGAHLALQFLILSKNSDDRTGRIRRSADTALD
jgi:hypothetical protein